MKCDEWMIEQKGKQSVMNEWIRMNKWAHKVWWTNECDEQMNEQMGKQSVMNEQTNKWANNPKAISPSTSSKLGA